MEISTSMSDDKLYSKICGNENREFTNYDKK